MDEPGDLNEQEKVEVKNKIIDNSTIIIYNDRLIKPLSQEITETYENIYDSKFVVFENDILSKSTEQSMQKKQESSQNEKQTNSEMNGKIMPENILAKTSQTADCGEIFDAASPKKCKPTRDNLMHQISSINKYVTKNHNENTFMEFDAAKSMQSTNLIKNNCLVLNSRKLRANSNCVPIQQNISTCDYDSKFNKDAISDKIPKVNSSFKCIIDKVDNVKAANEKGNSKKSINMTIKKPDRIGKEIIKGAFTCNHCKYKTGNKKHLISHLNTKHNSDKPYYCIVCKYKCSQSGNMTEHMRIHSGERPYFCKYCQFKCASKSNLIKHSRIHTGDKPFSCKFCQSTFVRKSSLTEHMRIHTGEKPFTCNTCKYKCAQRGDILKHMRTHTGIKPFSCTICHHKCARKSHLAIHMKSHTGEKPFSCKLCDHKCVQSSDLQKHMRTHSKKNSTHKVKVPQTCVL